MSFWYCIFLVGAINEIHMFSCTVYYVNPSSSNNGIMSGKSWLNSFNTLDSALQQATQTNDEIWLVGGHTYIPMTKRKDCFIVHKGVSIYGGFDGTESAITERRSTYAPSIISGDINILNDHSDDCHHAITYDEVLTLNRVSIQNGKTNHNSDESTQDYLLQTYESELITVHGSEHRSLLSPLTTQPNIIIFVIDDMFVTKQWKQSASFIDPSDLIDYPTPYINEFMSEGLIFPRAYCASPKCAPSRFAILTGRQPTRSEYGVFKTLAHSSGVFGTNVTVTLTKLDFNDSIYNIPYVLQNDINNPYYTGMVGKWHIMSSDDNGYDINCGTLSYFPNETLYNMCTDIVKEQGFDMVDAFYHGNIPENDYYSHNPEWMVSESIQFMDQAIHIENKPFFLHFALTLTHDPPPTFNALFNYTKLDTPKGILSAPNIPHTTMPTREQIWDQALLHGGTVGKTNSFAGYYWVDHTFGALIDYLKTNDLYNDTFIVLMNDHGMGAKSQLFEQGSRIIHFVRYPPLFGDTGHVVSDEFVVSNVDLAATIFELTGVTKPDKYKMDGKSWLTDVVNDIAGNNDEMSCCEYRWIDILNSHSIVSSEWQYIWRANLYQVPGVSSYPFSRDEQQLYNLKLDPDQLYNQMDNESLADVIIMFQKLMREYVSDVCPASSCKVPKLLSNKSDTSTSSTTFVPIATSSTNAITTTDEDMINVTTKSTRTYGGDAMKTKSDTMDVFLIISIAMVAVIMFGIVLVLFYRYYTKRKNSKIEKRKSQQSQLEIMRISTMSSLYHNNSPVTPVSTYSPWTTPTAPNNSAEFAAVEQGGDLTVLHADTPLEIMDECNQCNVIKDGKVDENDGLFYCTACWTKWQNDETNYKD